MPTSRSGSRPSGRRSARRRRELHPWLRGPLLGSAGLFVALAMLGQSRSWMVALPSWSCCGVVVPGRARTIAALALVGPRRRDLRAAARPPYGVRRRTRRGVRRRGTPSHVQRCWPRAAGVAGSAGRGDARRRRPQRTDELWLADGGFRRRLRAGATRLLGGRGQSAERDRATSGTNFKDGDGDRTPTARLRAVRGSYRYDYCVSPGTTSRHPLGGIGADNFGREYLLYGETGRRRPIPIASRCGSSPRRD